MRIEDAETREKIRAGELMCGCGKPIQYMVAMDPEVYACNKYFRCPTREELVVRVEELQKKLYEAKKYCTALLDLKARTGRGFNGTHEFEEAADWRELWRFIQTLP